MTDRVCGHTNPAFTYCNTGLLPGGATVRLVAPMIKRIGFLFSLCAVTALSAADFHGSFNAQSDRVWIGPEYWANPMEDWRVAGGRL